MNKSTDYGEKFKDHLLEQYKSYSDMAIRTSIRRDQSNRFYLLLLSGLLAFLSILVTNDQFEENQNVFLLTFGVLGFVICIVWYLNIHSYKVLSKAKYNVLRKMEEKLPHMCYKDEYDLLQEENYLQITKTEKGIAVIFSIPYLALIIYSVVNWC